MLEMPLLSVRSCSLNIYLGIWYEISDVSNASNPFKGHEQVLQAWCCLRRLRLKVHHRGWRGPRRSGQEEALKDERQQAQAAIPLIAPGTSTGSSGI